VSKGYLIVGALLLTLLDFILLVTLVTPILILVMLVLRQRWAWLLTPDVALPGDLSVVKDRGFFLTSFLWLMRNRWHGLDFVFAKRLPLAWDQSKFGLQTQGDLWWLRYPLGTKFQLKAGYRLNIVNNLPYGVPCCTITRS
jgi:hypothetical protein